MKLFVIYYDERARSDDEHYMYDEHGVFGSVESAMTKIKEIAEEEINYLNRSEPDEYEIETNVNENLLDPDYVTYGAVQIRPKHRIDCFEDYRPIIVYSVREAKFTP